MQAVINAINGIADGVRSALDFLGGMIADIVAMAEMLAEGLVALPTWFGYFFPAEVVVALVAVFAIVVIYKILGREG